MKTNVLYYGDNLEILRKYIPDECIDLIYLDPPFSSKRDYNVIFREPTGKQPEAQIKAFEDTWHWDRAAEDTFQDIVLNGPPKVAKLIDAMCDGIGRNDVMAYLVMMTIRLLELRRVLKDTGSLYLHCDPTASHYLKLVLDQVFGAKKFQNELVWYYRGGGASKRRFGRKHDTILFYTKGEEWPFNLDAVRMPYSTDVLESLPSRYDKSYRGAKVYSGYRPHPLGKIPDDVWPIQPIMPSDRKERLGYPTQKPLALLERIIGASSNEGDLVLDPFCGCGTALVAAQKLNRRWIGIDITYLAIEVMQRRLTDSFPGIQFEVEGVPKDLPGAYALKKKSTHQFELWALGLVGAKPLGKRDGGVDGVIDFQEDARNWARIAVQVKSGAVNPGQIRDLKGVIAGRNYAMGIFLTLEPPTSGMKEKAVEAGHYHHPFFNQDYPKVQILTIEELLLHGKKPDLPPRKAGFLPEAPKVVKPEGKQIALQEL